MDSGALRAAIEEEDIRFHEAIKRAAYEFDDRGNPDAFHAHIAELMEGSKARQRALFNEYLKPKQATVNNNEPVYPIPFPARQPEKSQAP